jgi:tetratricopeptide (TPR) repeat protein
MSKEESQAWRAPAVEGAIPPALQLWGILEPVLRMAHGGRYDITAQMIVSDLLYMRGVAQLRCGDVDAAVASWTSIEADLAPLKQIRNNIGSALAEEGRAERAIRFYEQALDEDPRYVLALRNKALVYRNRGDSSAAITTLRTLLQAEPKHREARLELARLLARTDATTVEALAEYEALAKADRHDPLPWREAGRLLHRIGDRPKAEAAYVEALRLDPEQEDVAEWLARLRRGIDLLAVDGPTPASGDVHGHGVAPSVPDVPPGTGVLWEYDPMLGIRVPKLPDRR